jgi:PAS domain S-box-containing protein
MLAALGSLVLLLLAVGSLSQWYRGRLISERRGQVAAELSLRGNALSAAINRRMALLDGLVAFVHVNAGHPLFDERFETYAAEIYTSAEGVRNIAMAPGGVVQNIYPLVGNQLVLGFDISTDPRPEVRQSVERAISTGEIVLIGPLDLVQGGQGLIARKAVFREGSYWGLVNLVIDAMPVLHRAGITEQAGGLSLALRNRDGAYLYGSAQVAELDPVTNPIQLPGDDWDLLAAPERGWEAAVRQDLLFFQISGSAIALLLVGLVYLSVNRQVWLARSVQERTRQISRINARLQEDIAQRKQAEASLSEREEQYRGVFETVRDGLFINSLEGELLAFNPAAHEMHGYSAEEFAKLRPEAFIHPDDLHFFFDCIHSVRVGNTYRCRARDIRKDGSIFYVEVFGSPFTYRGEPATLAVVRDISEQVEYAHTLELRVE